MDENGIVAPPTSPGDSYVRDFPKLLSKEEIKYFSKVSSWAFIRALLAEIFTITLVIWVTESYWNIPLYLLAVIILGSRLHALAILMHETAHYRAFNNRRVNDVVGEIVALPLTITMQGYRNNHFAHHRELNTEADPDWNRKLGATEFAFPKTRRAIFLQLSQFALGFKTYAMIKKTRNDKGVKSISERHKKIRQLFFLTLLATAIALGFWKQLLLYWIVPLLTSFGLFEHIRSVAEHFGVEYNHAFNHTRSVKAPLWERWLFASYGINYHLEHHLYPGVPFYRLAELHKFLMTKDEYAKSAHITEGYTKGLFRECALA